MHFWLYLLTIIPLPQKLILFGRGLYPGADSVYNMMEASGFHTIIVSSYYFNSNGDVYPGDTLTTSPIIHNGQYVGDTSFLRRIATLKPYARVEFLVEGGYNGPNLPHSFVNIARWARTPGGLDTLNGICQAFKALGADALCDDDEYTYDLPSTIAFGNLLQPLGMHLTLCPYTNYPFWKKVIAISASKQGLVDGVYLQCYATGGGNNPGAWYEWLGQKVPVYPIFACRGGFGTCKPSNGDLLPVEIKAQMANFINSYPGLSGGGIWQMADVLSYVQMNCAPITVSEYLRRLRNAVTPVVP